MATYIGYSSRQFEKTGSFALTDEELVKEDLLNHIFTRRGEVPMREGYGTIIPDSVFEPLDEELVDDIVEDVEQVINDDPRVRLLGLQTEPDYDNNRLNISISLRYIELNMSDIFNLRIEFEG